MFVDMIKPGAHAAQQAEPSEAYRLNRWKLGLVDHCCIFLSVDEHGYRHKASKRKER